MDVPNHTNSQVDADPVPIGERGDQDFFADERPDAIEQLSRVFDAVGRLVADVRPDQWSAPTPCTEWTVRRLVDHLIGMNRVFAALLVDEPPPPRPAAGHLEKDPVGAYRDSAARLLAVFEQPGVLERSYRGPLGAATGAERLQIRLYDLLAHGWDLARATGQPLELPDDVVEQSLTFVRSQLTDDARPGRFGAAQHSADDAPAVERLVAFLGRPVGPFAGLSPTSVDAAAAHTQKTRR